MSQTDGLTPFDIVLGKCITSDDPALISDENPQIGNMQSLKNMRYTDRGIKGIQGMTKINATAASYTSLKNGFHFRKDQPQESHIIVQTTDETTGNSRLVKSDNSASIPETDTFSNFLTLDNDNLVRYSKAPQGSSVACNGVKNYVWGGNEYRCGYFVVYDPETSSTRYDYSDIVNNTLTDSLNVAKLTTVGGGIDAYTKGMWHFENNFTDSSGNSHTLTNHSIAFSTLPKFGTYSAYCNASAYATVADHADFNISGGIWCFDVQANTISVATQRGLFCQATDANNYIYGYINTSGAVSLAVKAASSTVLLLTTANDAVNLGSYDHIAFAENGDDWYIFVNGKMRASTSSVVRPANYTGYGLAIGAFFDASSSSEWFYGRIDEARLSVGVSRYSADFTSPPSAYSTQSSANVFIGASRPIKGVKFYVENANTSSAVTASVNYWDGSAWQAVSGLTDGTSVSGKSLAQNGSIIFSDTESVAKVKLYNNSMAYWYQFSFVGLDDDVTISRVTLDASIQNIKDIWDGIPRDISYFFSYTGIYNDRSTAVIYEDYDSYNTGSYTNVGTLTSSQHILAGFSEQMTAIGFRLVEDNVNSTANTFCSISYWNGSSWTDVGDVEDNTSHDNKSLSKSGVMMWNAPSLDQEFTTSIRDESRIYYYKISFDQTLSSDVYIDYVYGIPSQKTLGQYSFPIFWQDRVWLCANQSDAKNSMKGSSYLSDCVFNGEDSPEISFDGDEELVAAVPIFSRQGGVIYENLVMCKRNDTYLVDTTVTSSTSTTNVAVTSTNYRVYKVADNIGCVAALTMQLCNIGFQLAPGINRHAAIWQSSGGIVMFDANSVIPISDDIQNFFDPADPDYINVSIIDKFSSFWDDRNKEYHWLFATGSSTTLNKEWAYDLKRRKWYEVVRPVPLQCGWNVQDALGNGYSYGGTTTGYIERLENGTTMDGSAITYSFRLLGKRFASAMYRTELRYIKLTGKTKSTSDQSVAMTHYADGDSTGTSLTAIPQTGTGKRIYQVVRSASLKAVEHSLEFSISTDDETIGFQPLMISGLYRVDKETVA
ncbi:MAG: hypothetical protein PHY29_03085 [Syntrophales bacterium]|nr:hypothetical protein [Syntrophales bacterium]